MTPPFGGTLRHDGAASYEVLPPGLGPALGAAFGAPHPPVLGLAPDDAPVVEFALVGDEIVYAADLSGASPWSAASLPERDLLGLLGRVARTLAVVHGCDRVHGDLRPELLLNDPTRGVVVLAPGCASAPGALLRARLHPGGAAVATVAFAAPEVVLGTEVSPASDVYSLAAVVFATLTGSAPLGRVGLPAYEDGPHGELARTLAQCLDPVAAHRPPMEALAAALTRAALAPRPASADTAPYRTSAPGPAYGSQASRPVRETSPVLVFTLLVGGFITFLGTVLLVSIGWSEAGVLGRGLLLAALSAGAFGLGALAERFKIDLGVVVARGVSAIFATVAIAFTFSHLEDPGRLGLLAALTAGAFVGGALAERREAPLGGAVLVGLGSQLLWTVGAQWIHMGHDLRGSGPVAVLGAVVSAVTYALALGRRAAPLAVVATLDLCVFFGALGDYLHTGSVMGPPGYALVVAAGYSLLAAGATRRGPDALAGPLGLAAGLAAVLSAGLGVLVMHNHPESHREVGALWPYLVALCAAVLSRAGGPLGAVALFVAGGLVMVVPTGEAFVRDTLGMAGIAVAVGALVVAGTLRSARLQQRPAAQSEALLGGLAGMLCVPGLRLAALLTRPEPTDLSEAGPWWGLVVATGCGLLVAAYAVTDRVRRDHHRLLEAAAVLSLLGALTLQVVATLDPLAPALAALGCALALALYGFVGRRAVVFLAGVGGLVIHGWIQYFVRLQDVLPLSIRLVGFGVGLLVAGVVYEQQLRPRVVILRDWH